MITICVLHIPSHNVWWMNGWMDERMNELTGLTQFSEVLLVIFDGAMPWWQYIGKNKHNKINEFSLLVFCYQIYFAYSCHTLYRRVVNTNKYLLKVNALNFVCLYVVFFFLICVYELIYIFIYQLAICFNECCTAIACNCV